MEWDQGGKFVWQDGDRFAHPPVGIKCRNCVMRMRAPYTHEDGTVTDDGYMNWYCRAWDGEPNRKPQSVLWHNGPCEAYWPDDGNWIGDEPM